MDGERKDKDRRESEEELARKGQGKDGKKGGGKGLDRPKGGNSALVPPPPPAPSKPGSLAPSSWPQGPSSKAAVDVDVDGAGKGRDKARGKDSWKEPWKERRRKQDKDEDGNNGGDHLANSQVLNGGALLAMLQANPSGARRYTREDLLSIGQLPASNVKPANLHAMIDKDNASSTLCLRSKGDKASRRRGDGDEDDYDEDGSNRRERRSKDRGGRRGASDEEDDEIVDDRGDWHGHKGQRWGGSWHDDEWSGSKDFGAGSHPSAASWQRSDEPQWDMPEVSAGQEGSLLEFTLGDIRKAEKSIASGMSMNDYKASLRTGAAEAPAERKSSDPFQDGGSFFVEEEEEEDMTKASRGFGKWFGSSRAAEQEASPATTPTAVAAPAGPVQQAPVPAAAPAPATPPGPILQTSTPAVSSMPARPPATANSRPTGQLVAPVAPGIVGGSAPSAPPVQRHVEPARPSQRSPAASTASNHRVPAPAGPLGRREDRSSASAPSGGEATSAASTASNSAGRSILSMLGRPGDDDGAATAPATASQEDAASAQAKLSVADLFQIAKGQQLPPIPPMTSAPPRNSGSASGGGGAAANAAGEDVEALKMATQLMWAAAAKASGSAANPPAGSRYPGYQQPGLAASYGVGAGRGQALGRGQAEWEAMAQAQAQAAMSMGRGYGSGQFGYPQFPGARSAAYGAAGYHYASPDELAAQLSSERGFDSTSDVAAMAAAVAAAQQAKAQASLGQRPSSFAAGSAASEASRSAFQAGPGLEMPRGNATGLQALSSKQGAEDDAGCSQS
eukprot:TRINITY_DN39189_c0_g1_i1.p1 TRINITY_DN39189_c0_g1~~TRINITY_DN39189_c0_g1_i1.p1  ORF type:complete len:791 (+),score=206.61 TRINITY_DN39189_c0_g1_i1:123-2495(+)